MTPFINEDLCPHTYPFCSLDSNFVLYNLKEKQSLLVFWLRLDSQTDVHESVFTSIYLFSPLTPVCELSLLVSDVETISTLYFSTILFSWLIKLRNQIFMYL